MYTDMMILQFNYVLSSINSNVGSLYGIPIENIREVKKNLSTSMMNYTTTSLFYQPCNSFI